MTDTHTTAGPPGSCTRPNTIAVALSNPVDQELLGEYLGSLGYRVTPLRVDDSDLDADLVILDVKSARAVGSRVLACKRNAPTFLPTLVVVSQLDPVEPWLEAGFDYCLRLPLKKAPLRAIIALLLRQREQASLLVQASEARYRAVFEATGTATILVEADGTISLANKECLRVTGYSAEELVGTKWTEYVAPESLEMMLAYHQARREGDATVPNRYEARMRRKDGSLRDVMVTVGLVPVTAQSVVSMVDVTEERAAAAALEASEAFFRRLFQDHSAPKLILDPLSGQILDANQAAARLYGWSREELTRMTIDQINCALSEEIDQARRQVLQGKQSRFEFTHRRADGSPVEVEVFSTGIQIPGREPVIYAIVHDISDRRRAEQEKLELERQLAQAQKMEAIGRLAGGMAHDFNNLLTTILGYCELLLAGTDRYSESVRSDIGEIKASAERAAALTRQILAFSRRQTLRPRVVCLNDVVEQMESFLRRTLGETIELITFPAPDLAATEIDTHQFERVLMNLALNARDAMPAGGRLIIETANVKLDEDYCRTHPEAAPGSYVMLSVTDTGVGMSPEVMSHVFEPFFTTKPPEQGSGLGLSTVYGIVRQSGGTVCVYSELGQGTTFKIYLPVVEALPTGVPVESTTPTRLEGRETVLVVEDEPSVRDLVCRVLGELGYQLFLAATADEALELVHANRLRPDLILTDVVLPGRLQGNDLVRALLADQPDVKVLYMSGYTRNAIVHGGKLDEGVNFLEKPFSPRALTQAVRRVLDGS